jgi:ATP-binding protein involved in chromosome partitioning
MPVLGVVENMRKFRCTCGSEHEMFGAGGGDDLSEEYDIPVLESLPLTMDMRKADDPLARDYDSEVGEKLRILSATVADYVGATNRRRFSKGKSTGPLRPS